MQLELKKLQKKLGITFIYITHDQEEAINMSDRIAVMNHGQIEQIGTPDEIYNHPETSYVAAFVGNANILKGVVTETGKDLVSVQIGNDTVSVLAPEDKPKKVRTLPLRSCSENIILNEKVSSGLKAKVLEKNFAGGQLRVTLGLADGTRLIASRYGIDVTVEEGQQVSWGFHPSSAVLVDRRA